MYSHIPLLYWEKALGSRLIVRDIYISLNQIILGQLYRMAVYCLENLVAKVCNLIELWDKCKLQKKILFDLDHKMMWKWKNKHRSPS